MPKTIAAAAALPAQNVSGSIMDVEHVVVLMQENRSFDHYFGCLKGVRGFGDPRALVLPSGAPVWFQPTTPGAADQHAPFRLNAKTTSAESIASLDHNWKGSHELWKNYDAWIHVKSPMSMGYFQREDIPFYYALADAFTVCDAYHCSLFGPTNPNRMFLFSGTNGLSAGLTGPLTVTNPPNEPNETADQTHDGPLFPGFAWKTYAERLQGAGVSWKIYQEYDNFGDNGLAYFKSFRGMDTNSELYKRARAWAPGSNAENAKASRGEHLVAAFSQDVASGSLPQISWIVAPTVLCEHPSATPSSGEQLTERLIKALAAHPEVWAKTVFILNYDESDGFFDHVPPPLPAVGEAVGKGNIDTAGELYGAAPVGLGPRVPLIVVSPWSKGGFVNSELFDHTSVIRFMEARFGVSEPNITPWRRAVCGDLTSCFDFRTPNAAPPRLPSADHAVAVADLTAHLPKPAPAPKDALPKQEPGQRPTRPLPYDVHVSGVMDADGFHLQFANEGAAGAVFQVFAAGANPGPWYYSVAARTTLKDVIHPTGGQGPFDVSVYGPGGLFRRWKAKGFDVGAPTAVLSRDGGGATLKVTLTNPGVHPVSLRLINAYEGDKARTSVLKPKETRALSWPLGPTDHWYDVAVSLDGEGAYLRHFAGHFETGAPSRSDPLIGAPSRGWGGRMLGVVGL